MKKVFLSGIATGSDLNQTNYDAIIMTKTAPWLHLLVGKDAAIRSVTLTTELVLWFCML